MLLEHHFVCMHISITLISRVTDGEIQRTKQEKEGERANFNCTLHGFSFGLFRLEPGSVRKCYGVATSCCGYVFVDFFLFMLSFVFFPCAGAMDCLLLRDITLRLRGIWRGNLVTFRWI